MSSDVRTTDEFEEQYQKLNDEQKRAVDAIEGPVMVVAGPGSGKTQILSMRVGNILKQTDALPSNILCLTFTDSAAANMRERLASLIGRDAYRVAIHTFHSFGVEIIQKHPEYFYGGATFAPADQLKQIEVLETIFAGLAHDNPLNVEHPDQGFVFLRPTLKAIGELKKAGLRPEEFEMILSRNKKALEEINPKIDEVFGVRLSKKQFDAVEGLAEELRNRSDDELPSRFPRLADVVRESLERALAEAREEDATKPLSEWKEKWTKPDDEKRRVLKDALHLERLEALADVYARYQKTMHDARYFDFDDMLLDTISALEEHDALRYDIQEQYHYLLVDEFQDTNDAQMRLLRQITDAEVNEGRPNIMAVGDDDQAVYKFQGAEISNILDFKNTFRDPEIITLTKNYRSTQDILDVATDVISKGEERLENVLPEIEKQLVASREDLSAGDIVHTTFPTNAHENQWVAQKIREYIDSGVNPDDIAVITRKHEQLENLVPYLASQEIPIHYERQQNVFREPHIHQLITMSRFVDSLIEQGRADADEYLPEILAYPFWELDRQTIWEISVEAFRSRKLWLEVMQEHKREYVRTIAEFFLDLAKQAKYQPLERVIDEMVGAHVPLMQEGEDELVPLKNNDGTFNSPFKSYYFSRQRQKGEHSTYLTFLSSLRVFTQALREYRHGEPLRLRDLVAFVDIHEKNNLTVNDQSPFTNAQNAVQLLTAHKAKGLEFDTVFVLSCQHNIWAGRGPGNKISFCSNLAITPAGDGFDDQLRLFYVALTRAQRHLYLSSYERDEKGKDATPLSFLIPDGDERTQKLQALRAEEQGSNVEPPDTSDALTASWLEYHTPEFSGDEESFLKSLLSDYQMSVTHLNNFLDIARGGPQKFLEQNLLRFPKAKTPVAGYGTAVHAAIERIYLHLKKNREMPVLDDVLGWFEGELAKQRLAEEDHELYLNRGRDALTVYLNATYEGFDPTHQIEVDFKHQGVLVDGVHISGKIDKMVEQGPGSVSVHDFKTGKPYSRWKGSSPEQDCKLRDYQRQLIFYKLLVEESRDYDKYSVEKGVLEFVHPSKTDGVGLELEITDDMVEHQRKLIKAVHDKIMNLEFPDVSVYTADVKGVKQFEEDLVHGEV